MFTMDIERFNVAWLTFSLNIYINIDIYIYIYMLVSLFDVDEVLGSFNDHRIYHNINVKLD